VYRVEGAEREGMKMRIGEEEGDREGGGTYGDCRNPRTVDGGWVRVYP
jgi:hypothetical protein